MDDNIINPNKYFNNKIKKENDIKKEHYINLDDLCIKKKIFQIQLDNKNLKIKYVGNVDDVCDIVLMDKFGKNNSYTSYSCIYTEDELKPNTIIPLIRITDNIRQYCICVMIDKIEIDTNITDFKIYFLQKQNINKFFIMDKNIDNLNIIDVLLNKLLDLGIFIYE